MKRWGESLTVLGGAAVALLGIVACAGSGPEPSAAKASVEGSPEVLAPPSFDDVANATYSGIYDETVTLSEGAWEGEPFGPGGASRPTVILVDMPLPTGDLDGDEVEEVATLLVESSGGSGTIIHLAVMGRRGSTVTQLGHAEVGDRVRVRSFAIEGDRVVIETVQAGPEDAFCCPTEKRRRAWRLARGTLEEAESETEGTFSLADLAAVEWVLTGLSFGDDAPGEPEIILVFGPEVGEISGFAGCNAYFGTAESTSPGELRFGPMGMTRKACPPAVSELESCYVRALGAATGSRWSFGRLALDYALDDATRGALLFTPRSLEDPVAPEKVAEP